MQDPKVRAEVWVDLNGEGSHLFIDPYYNLVEAEDGTTSRGSFRAFGDHPDGLEAMRPHLRAQHGW